MALRKNCAQKEEPFDKTRTYLFNTTSVDKVPNSVLSATLFGLLLKGEAIFANGAHTKEILGFVQRVAEKTRQHLNEM